MIPAGHLGRDRQAASICPQEAAEILADLDSDDEDIADAVDEAIAMAEASSCGEEDDELDDED